MVSGAVLAAAGVIIVATLPYPPALTGPATLAWCAWSVAELLRLGRAYRRPAVITVYPDGGIEIEREDGWRASGRLGPGSLLLRRWAWLRVQVPGAGSRPELLLLNGQDREQWRRFQVISRHLTAC